MIALLVALAGGVGAVLRHGVDSVVVPRTSHHLPWSTLLINVTGSFALGLLIGGTDTATASRWWIDAHTILGTGLLGGYTTFSAASVEAARRLLEGRTRDGLLTAVLMPAACIAAAAAGLAV